MNKEKAKVAFIDANINFGGAPRGTVDLAFELKKYFDVLIFDVFSGSRRYVDYIKRREIKFSSLNPESKNPIIGGGYGRFAGFLRFFIRNFSSYWFLRKNIINENVDLVWVNNKKALHFVLFAFLNVPVILYVRSDANDKEFDFIYRALVRLKVNAIVTHSRAAEKKLKSYKLKGVPIEYIPNSVLIDQPIRDRDIGVPLRILLPCARPVKEKGCEESIRAIFELQRKGIDSILYISGEVPYGVSEDYLKYLVALSEELGVSDQVVFTGFLENVQEYISSCDIIILPSYMEGFPRVVIEAMLMKRVVIASKVGGIPDAIVDKRTGLLVDPGSKDQLVMKIEWVVKHPGLLKDIVEKAYTYAKSHFDGRVQAHQFSIIAKRILEKQNDGS